MLRTTWRTAPLGILLLCSVAAPADDWPQWMGPKRDGIWREDGILDKFPPGGPKRLWATPIGGGFSGPAVASGRVYVMDRQGEKLPKGKEAPMKGGLAGKERVLCLDDADGKILWKHEYDCPYRVYYPSGPRTTPTVHQGKVYTLGAMGNLLCLDAEKGTVHWNKDLLQEYETKPPLWGYANHLLVDGDAVFTFAGGKDTKDCSVIALHKDTGKELWRALTVEEVGYAPFMMIEAGGKRQLIVWHTEAINSLDPPTGKVYWTEKFPIDDPVRPAITAATPRHVGDLLFVSSPHHGSLMLRLDTERPAANVLWRGKSNSIAKPEGLHAMMNSPILGDGHVYGICAFGELRCLDALTGKRLWEHKTVDRKAMGPTTFLIPHKDRVFLFSDQGDLIITRLTPQGYEEIDRAHVIEPTLFSRGRDVVWSHPAFANRCIYLRNDQEIVCISLKA
jgi:outer membrane protein assembly factor BamB